MNKILILTTKGCEACTIAKNNVDIAIKQTGKQIELEIKDWREEGRNFVDMYRIKDYPAVLYFIDNKLVNKAIGTYPSAVYLRWIDIHFKN